MRQYFCCWPTASFKWNIGPTDGPYLREEHATEKSIFRIFFFSIRTARFLSSPAIRLEERKYLCLKDCALAILDDTFIEASDISYGYL